MDTGNTRVDFERKTINIHELKTRLSKKYPNSSILSILLSLPDTIDAEELVGATAILLDLLDREKRSYNNLNTQKGSEELI
jgi:hypothetical protein